MKHLKLHLGIALDLALIKRDDILISDPEPGGIKLEFRFFLGGDPDAHLKGIINGFAKQVDLLVIVNDRDTVPVSLVYQPGNIADIGIPLETVAQHIGVRTYKAFPLQILHNIDIKSRGGLDVDVVFKGFLQDVLKMGALRAIAIVIPPRVVVLFHGIGKPGLGPVYVLGNFGEVGKFKRTAVGADQVHQGHPVKFQARGPQVEFLCGEIVCLINQISIGDIHLCLGTGLQPS